MKFAFISSGADQANIAKQELITKYGNYTLTEADVIVPLGGDGFMITVLHETMNTGKKIYGMNRGSIGFLMNEFSIDNLEERIEEATANVVHPIEMKVVDTSGNIKIANAINEISVFRASGQAAKLSVSVAGKTRLEELICDGLIVSTPVGSTAYNLSAGGPIIPLEAPLYAMTPVCAFRPRRWKGAILPDSLEIEINVIESEKRPVNAVADHTEINNVDRIIIGQATYQTGFILSDPERSWSDKILNEQFMV